MDSKETTVTNLDLDVRWSDAVESFDSSCHVVRGATGHDPTIRDALNSGSTCSLCSSALRGPCLAVGAPESRMILGADVALNGRLGAIVSV